MKVHQVSILGILVSVAIASAVGLAGGTGGATIGGIPVFFACGIIAFVIQWLMFIPAYLYQTEKYYDLTGSLTYISLTLIALDFAPVLDGGRLLIAAMVIIWAVRLGSFLFARIRADGHDVRFAKIKPSFLRFLMTWTLQGLWVFLTFSAGLAAITSLEPHPIGPVVIVGALLWLIGFSIEVIADKQKGAFRSVAANRDTFISHGLWKYSRHPNYFGEILLWLGIAVAAFPVLSGWQSVTLISPVFVYLLLTQVSGVKMLEARALRRWGHDEAYQAYLKKTPSLMLNPWSGR
ncbi:MAG: DUF1295 domain-containing protein [Halioglobus sp.]